MPKFGEFRDKTALETLLEGQQEAQKELVDASTELVSVMLARVVALEKRVWKLEDVVREILERTAGIGRVVQTSQWQAHGEQLSPGDNSQGGAVPASDGVPVSLDSGETVKRNT